MSNTLYNLAANQKRQKLAKKLANNIAAVQQVQKMMAEGYNLEQTRRTHPEIYSKYLASV